MVALIYFDLETTKLGRQAEIIQIGAVHENGEEFSCYIVPDGDIDPQATEVNGFSKHQNGLRRRENLIENAVSPKRGLKRFIRWLRNMQTEEGEQFNLVAHNSYKFDGPVLINNLLNPHVANMDTIRSLVAGIGDSLVAFRKFCEGPHNLQSLLIHGGIRGEQTHDALDDASALKELVELVSRPPTKFLLQYKPVDHIRLRV